MPAKTYAELENENPQFYKTVTNLPLGSEAQNLILRTALSRTDIPKFIATEELKSFLVDAAHAGELYLPQLVAKPPSEVPAPGGIIPPEDWDSRNDEEYDGELDEVTLEYTVDVTGTCTYRTQEIRRMAVDIPQALLEEGTSTDIVEYVFDYLGLSYLDGDYVDEEVQEYDSYQADDCDLDWGSIEVI